MKKILFILFVIALLFSINATTAKATGGKLRSDSLITCNGNDYAQHSSDDHWHLVKRENGVIYADGDSLGTENPCGLKSDNHPWKSGKIEATFVKCVDGDTAKFEVDGEQVTTRFLAVDTPETVHPSIGEEPYGKEASNLTCSMLTDAKKIELELDDDSDKFDKYYRLLVWVHADGVLIQDELIKSGFAEVAYLYGDYKYTPLLQDHEAVAKANKVGMWSGEEPVEETEELDPITIIYYVIGVLVLHLVGYFGNFQQRTTIKKVLEKPKKTRVIHLIIYVVTIVPCFVSDPAIILNNIRKQFKIK